MKRFILVLAGLLFTSGAPAQQNVGDVKRAEVSRLMDAMGVKKMMDTIIPQMMEQISRQAQASIPASVARERSVAIIDYTMRRTQEELKHFDIEGLSISIYEKHFTTDEIRALIQFYESPVGKKLLAVMPAIMQDSINASAEWSQGLQQRIMNEVMEKFPELKTPPHQ